MLFVRLDPAQRLERRPIVDGSGECGRIASLLAPFAPSDPSKGPAVRVHKIRENLPAGQINPCASEEFRPRINHFDPIHKISQVLNGYAIGSLHRRELLGTTPRPS